VEASTTQDSDGISLYLIVISDISERKRAEEALRRNEAKHSKMVANIGDVIVIIDQNGINRYKSPNIEKWFGWPPEEVVGVSALENVHSEELNSAQSFIGALWKKPNATATTECRYRCKDGSYKWIEFTGVNLLHDPDIGGILGNYHDITERKLAEQALRASDARYRAVAQSAHDAIITADSAGNIVGWNQGAEHLFGYTEIEASSQPLTMLLPLRYHDGHLAGMARMQAGGG
jgi:PAS domain S-box-containing protein